MPLIQARELIEVHPTLKEKFARISEMCAPSDHEKTKKACRKDRETWDACGTDKKVTVAMLNVNTTAETLRIPKNHNRCYRKSVTCVILH